jgi:signal transduction histidine kinase/ligand-binding sensor domain-containing protein
MRVVLFYACMLLSPLLLAQEFSIEQFTIKDGLPQSQVRAIAEDHFGYLWIGTGSGGLLKFDGKEFTRYSTKDGLLSNFVKAIQIDDNNNIWIAHDIGVSKYNGHVFKTFEVPEGLKDFRTIKSICSIGDTLFVISFPGMLGKIANDSVYQWNGKCEGQSVSTIQKGPDNAHYFFLLNGQVVAVKKDGTRKRIQLPVEYPFITDAFNVSESIVARTSELTVEIKNDSAFVIPEDRYIRGTLLFESTRNEYWIRKRDTLSIQHGNEVNTILSGVTVLALCPDSEGNYWVGTDGNGMFKVRRRGIRRIESTAGLKISRIAMVNDNEWWLATFGNGVLRYKDGKLTPVFHDNDRKGRTIVNDIKLSYDNNVWIATTDGIGIFSRQGNLLRWLSRENGLPGKSFADIQFDSEGKVWLGTLFMGSVILSKTDTIVVNKSNSQYGNILYSSFYDERRKQLAFGYKSGYVVTDSIGLKVFPLPSIRNSAVISMCSFRDSLMLLGTLGSGIVIHNPKSNNVTSINSSNGIISDFIYFIRAEEDGAIWVGTEKGVSKLTLDRDFNVLSNMFYSSEETNQNAVWIGKGHTFFGMIDGLYEYYPDDDERMSARSFPLHFTSIQVAPHAPAINSNAFYAIPVNRNLDYRDNNITFSFAQIDKADPGSVVYRYKLLHFDPTWSTISALNKVTYSNLPPGHYTFEVRVSNPSGLIDENSFLRYSFTINPPFYQTASFLTFLSLAVVLLIAGVVYTVMRERVRKLLAIEKIRIEQQELLRKQMAQDFHDDVGNQLARIINFISQLHLTRHPENQRQLYKKIEDTAKNLYQGTKELIWSMNPENENLNQVIIHIKEFGEQLFADKEVEFYVHASMEETIQLPLGHGREVNLIFKEAMTNIYKYAQATRVEVSFHRMAGGTELSITDNGIGFQASAIVMGNGLNNMQTRANRIKASLSVYSEEGRGTTIVLKIKDDKAIKYVKTGIKKAYSDH